jgi:uncharacterized Zn ribbon protein
MMYLDEDMCILQVKRWKTKIKLYIETVIVILEHGDSVVLIKNLKVKEYGCKTRDCRT